MSKVRSTLLSIALLSCFTWSFTASTAVQAAAPAPKALSVLAKIPTRAWASHSGYARSQFGDGWGKIGSCDTRNYILVRDLKSVSYRTSPACTVATGVLHDPYTGRTINFVRGVGTSLAVQIDHVVALSNAWSTGAQSLSYSTRVAMANDPLELLAVDGPTNEAKSDSDAANWLPPRTAYWCPYVARQVAVKAKYHLWMTTAEKAAIGRVLRGRCPNQLVPRG